MCGRPRLLDPVKDLAVEVEAEEPDKHMTEDRRSIPEIEFISLDQALECGEMVFDQVSGLIQFVDLLGMRRNRGENQDPPARFNRLFSVSRSILPSSNRR